MKKHFSPEYYEQLNRLAHSLCPIKEVVKVIPIPPELDDSCEWALKPQILPEVLSQDYRHPPVHVDWNHPY